MTSKKNVYTITASFSIGIAATYLFHFHNGFSQSSSDWGNFADYIGGLISPLLALLNIIVFIDLTKSIEQNRLAYEKSKDTEQELRHQKEVEHQKQMQLFQLRTEEIRRLDNSLEDAFYSKVDEIHGNIPLSIVKAMSYIESFLKNKMDIFPFSSAEEKKELQKLLEEGYHSLAKIGNSMAVINNPIDKNDMVQYLNFKSNVIKKLYALTMDN